MIRLLLGKPYKPWRHDRVVDSRDGRAVHADQRGEIVRDAI
jgi:hypothetical protein